MIHTDIGRCRSGNIKNAIRAHAYAIHLVVNVGNHRAFANNLDYAPVAPHAVGAGSHRHPLARGLAIVIPAIVARHARLRRVHILWRSRRSIIARNGIVKADIKVGSIGHRARSAPCIVLVLAI